MHDNHPHRKGGGQHKNVAIMILKPITTFCFAFARRLPFLPSMSITYFRGTRGVAH